MRPYPKQIFCPGCAKTIERHPILGHDGVIACDAPQCFWYWCPTCREVTQVQRVAGVLGMTKYAVKTRKPFDPQTTTEPDP